MSNHLGPFIVRLHVVGRLTELGEALQDEAHLTVQRSPDAVDLGGRITTQQVHLLRCLADIIPVRTRVIDPALLAL